MAHLDEDLKRYQKRVTYNDDKHRLDENKRPIDERYRRTVDQDYKVKKHAIET